MERATYRLACGRCVPARIVRRAGAYALIHYVDRFAPLGSRAPRSYLRRRLVRAFVHAKALS